MRNLSNIANLLEEVDQLLWPGQSFAFLLHVEVLQDLVQVSLVNVSVVDRDRKAFSSEPTRATNPMQIVLSVTLY